MFVFRRVRDSDVDSLFELVQQSELGLTTLKISRDEMAARIEQSVFAFEQRSTKPAGQPYVFVLEESETGLIVGTSAIYAKVGGFQPFYSYQIKTSIHHSDDLNVHKEIPVLHLHEEHDGPSEIGSLFLSPDYWGQGLGRLLSTARFLFVADFPDRFEQEVIAELRGVVHPDGTSPLWKALGSHFFQIDYPRAETLTSKSKKFIADLMPRHPIYIPLLPDEARKVIGRVHRNTEPAKAVLESEGFEFRDLVDIFDGGPTVHCARENIRAVRESRTGTIAEIGNDSRDSESLLISNCAADYRVCVGDLRWNADGTCTLDTAAAATLGLGVGDTCRAVAAKAP